MEKKDVRELVNIVLYELYRLCSEASGERTLLNFAREYRKELFLYMMDNAEVAKKSDKEAHPISAQSWSFGNPIIPKSLLYPYKFRQVMVVHERVQGKERCFKDLVPGRWRLSQGN